MVIHGIILHHFESLRLRSHRNIRYTVYATRYTVFAIRYTGTTVHIEVARVFNASFREYEKSCEIGILKNLTCGIVL